VGPLGARADAGQTASAAAWTRATSPPALVEAAAAARGTVGFAAVELASGRALALHADQGFPMQSVFKLPIAIVMLREVDAGRLALEQAVALDASDARGGPPGTTAVPARRTLRELIEAMIINSDNVACEKLLALAGGPRAVDAYVRGLGISGMRIAFSEREMQAGRGDNTSTPRAMIALLEKIAHGATGLSTASARRLDDLLARVTFSGAAAGTAAR
jgi:beta-lactamase class A